MRSMKDWVKLAKVKGVKLKVKLVEACWRGWRATTDGAFADAARTVTARSRRPAVAGSRSR